jgi:hypothetical protein
LCVFLFLWLFNLNVKTTWRNSSKLFMKTKFIIIIFFRIHLKQGKNFLLVLIEFDIECKLTRFFWHWSKKSFFFFVLWIFSEKKKLRSSLLVSRDLDWQDFYRSTFSIPFVYLLSNMNRNVAGSSNVQPKITFCCR